MEHRLLLLNSPRNRWLLGLLAATMLLAMLGALHIVPLRAEEPRRAIVALEMLLSGNYIAPTINGIFYYNKPPLYNWLLVGLFQLLGTANWVVRLPSPIFLWLTAAVNVAVVRRYLSLEVALLSSLCYVFSADIVFYFSVLGEIDLFYSFVVYCQAMAIFVGYERRQWRSLYLLSYALTAAGLLTKGLPSLPFQVLTLAAVAFYTGQWRWLFSKWHLAGIALLGVLWGGYFYQYQHYNRALTYLLKLFTESSQHAALEKSLWSSVSHLLAFPFTLLKLLLPWSLLLLFVPAYRTARSHLQQHALLRFSWWFVVANVGIYWLSPGTRDRYLYMFLPFISILWCYFYSQATAAHRGHRWLRHIISGIWVLLIAVFAALPYLPDLGNTPHIGGIAVVLVALSVAALYIHYRRWFADILLLALAVVVLRCAFDVVVLPTQARTIDQKIYAESASKIQAITHQQPVYLYGNIQTHHAYFQPLGKVLLDVAYQQPPFLPFQTSFYLSRHNHAVVQCTNQQRLQQYYIANKSELPTDRPTQVLYEFFEPRSKISYVLFVFTK